MFGLPPMPTYEGLHPSVVHFPIGILLIAWLPMLIALIDKPRRSGWLASAAMLLIVGTIACFAAVMTGEATEDAVTMTTQTIDNAIHDHEETAELARNLYLGVLALFLTSWLATHFTKPTRKKIVATIGFGLTIILYTVSSLTLINAGHQGGMLVHQHGIHAPTAPASITGTVEDAYRERQEDDDD